MRHSLAFVIATAIVLAPASGEAAVTVNDLVKLSAAGLGDDILIALIESDDSVFKLSADDILSLRAKGLSEKVILAMIQTSRKPQAQKPARPARDVVPAPELPGADAPDVAPVEVAPPAPAPEPVPVIVNVTQQVEQHVEAPRETSRVVEVPVPVAVPVYVPARVDRRPAPAPVYWGFNGQRRPDTWKDPGKDKDKDRR